MTFTVTATADSTGNGYTASDSYTFIFTANSNFATGPNNFYNASQNRWGEGADSIPEDELWTSVSGTGVSGTYSHPS